MRKNLPPLTNCAVILETRLEKWEIWGAIRAAGISQPEQFAFPTRLTAEIKSNPNKTVPSVSPSQKFNQIPIYITEDHRQAGVVVFGSLVPIWKVVAVRRNIKENRHMVKEREIRRLREMFAFEFGKLAETRERARKLIEEIKVGELDKTIQKWEGLQ